MSYNELKYFIDALETDGTLTGYVPTSQIKSSWDKWDEKFPCIIISRIGGTAMPQLGYSSAGGSKIHHYVTVQVDIFAKDWVVETYRIADALEDALFPTPNGLKGIHKVSDVDIYDKESQTYRKTLTFTYFKDVD